MLHNWTTKIDPVGLKTQKTTKQRSKVMFVRGQLMLILKEKLPCVILFMFPHHMSSGTRLNAGGGIFKFPSWISSASPQRPIWSINSLNMCVPPSDLHPKIFRQLWEFRDHRRYKLAGCVLHLVCCFPGIHSIFTALLGLFGGPACSVWSAKCCWDIWCCSCAMTHRLLW